MNKLALTLVCLTLLAIANLVTSLRHEASKGSTMGNSEQHNGAAHRNHSHLKHNLHHKGHKANTHGSLHSHGMINRNACSLCEPLVGQRVCGKDGHTYQTLCHAVNCAGLTEKEVAMGACNETGVCERANCKMKGVCIPQLANCIPWKTSRGRSIRCRAYYCAATDCKESEQVCGMDGKTYSSLCKLYKAKGLLAYRGRCSPKRCKGLVCGTDGETYFSSCHVRAKGARVHYSGKCFLDHQLDQEYKRGSVCNLISTRCKNLTCRDPFLPPDSCCKTCGGGLLLQQKSVTSKAAVASIKKFDLNAMSTIKQLLSALLPPGAQDACDLSVTFTNNGYTAVLLEESNMYPGRRSLFCKAASRELAKRISNPISNKSNTQILMLAKLYEVAVPDLTATLPNPEMFIGFDPLGDLQDTTTDLKNQASNKASNTYSDSSNAVDGRLSDAEDSAYNDAAATSKLSPAVIMVIMLIMTVI